MPTRRSCWTPRFAVVGGACSTATGAFDPLDAIADFAEEHSLWFHVDAAHGGAAALSSRYRSLLRGVERGRLGRHRRTQDAANARTRYRRSLPALPARPHALFSRNRATSVTRRLATSTRGGTAASAPRVHEAHDVPRALRQPGAARHRDIQRACRADVRPSPTVRRHDQRRARLRAGNCATSEHRLLPPRARGGRGLDRLQLRIREAILRAGDFYIVKARLPTGLYLGSRS